MPDQTYAHHNPHRTRQWQDWANLALAVWFFISPWILQFGYSAPTGTPAATQMAVSIVSNAAWNAWVVSVIVFVVALSAIGQMAMWQEWVNLVLGAWIFIAPWVLGFSSGVFPAAAWDHWIVGALVFIISATTAFNTRRAEV